MGQYVDMLFAMVFAFCLWSLPVVNMIFPYFYDNGNEEDLKNLRIFNVVASFIVLASFPDQAAINQQFAREMGKQ
ncbi:hypothetical protein ASPVEDRAFT_88819 [Aspergillus versicolor CBS 583.65]|uniref:Uncharacterized protein n=1 Tax=Aspergillus versicolor CBS 583.65 TaxID=1036611 RepID=A0A1L9Q1H5_ASPVE|nr:uncharacterized protein ASPVEDRAFT_88819 [Aspergillus versicolor CBS 583.65]OJJ07579.1 hypothetical protein ASPVEDRAFT_88819 [Aspergillus versicolor CBS 583.65]